MLLLTRAPALLRMALVVAMSSATLVSSTATASVAYAAPAVGLDTRAPASSQAGAPTGQVPAFARVGDVELVSPSPAIRLVGFHESAGGTVPLQPVQDVQPMMTLPSRARGTHPRSAVDIAMPVGADVAAVATGTVTAVNPYALYGSTKDYIVEIAPSEDPSLRVKMLHVAEVSVAVGDEVVAGETKVAGSARLLPFGSQIDRHTGQRTPHLHVEVTR